MDVKDIVIKSDIPLKDALEALNHTGIGILFISNNEDRLIGVLTDGDVRRALINGANLDVHVSKCMKKDFFSLPVTTPSSEILSNITDEIKIIPLLDELGRAVDYASIHQIHRIPVASPLLDGNELAYVTECIKTNWISSQGRFVMEFERQFEEYHQMPKALAVSNGTVALHLALVALGIGKDDEVIVPDFTFAASINAILYTNATPVIVDIDRRTLTISISAIRKAITSKTKAILPVHLYGYPCDMDEIMNIAEQHDLKVIEDCAEALGSFYKGKPVGSFGDASTFSFFGNKTITTGEGGMVIFKNFTEGDYGVVLRDHGMSKSRRYWHEYVGFNYRMTNMQAALGVAQMEKLEFFVERKKWIAETYNKCLAALGCFEIPKSDVNVINSFWLYTFMIKEESGISREELMEKLSNNGIETRPVFYPLHTMPPYKKYGNANSLENSIWVSKHGMSLPSFVNLSEKEIDYVCKSITQITKGHLVLK